MRLTRNWRIGLSMLALLLLSLNFAACKETRIESSTSDVTHVSDPSELGNLMANDYNDTLQAVQLLVDTDAPATLVKTDLTQLRQRMAAKFVEYGQKLEQLTQSERLRAESVYERRLDEMDVAWLNHAADRYRDQDADTARLVRSFVPLARYWNLDWIRQQYPDDARSLGLTG